MTHRLDQLEHLLSGITRQLAAMCGATVSAAAAGGDAEMPGAHKRARPAEEEADPMGR